MLGFILAATVAFSQPVAEPTPSGFIVSMNESLRSSIQQPITHSPRCPVAQNAMLVAQGYDYVNSLRHWWKYDGYQEKDPIVLAFSGGSHRSAVGTFVSGVAVDLLASALTRKSHTLRCVVQGALATASAIGIIGTNADVPAFRHNP